jgi:hypothetical protein
MGEPDDPLFEIVMATRFNATTFAEFQTHLARRRPAFYNTPCPITRTRVPSSPNVVLYVLEMHNDANVLMGVGLVRNEPTISPPPVYRDRRYNFYGYPIERRLAFRAADERGRPAADLDPRLDGPQRELIASLEATLFRGKTHAKRGRGITQIMGVSHREAVYAPLRAMLAAAATTASAPDFPPPTHE